VVASHRFALEGHEATTLWAGAKSLYGFREHGGDPAEHALAGWL
jgi:hypothetical protein